MTRTGIYYHFFTKKLKCSNTLFLSYIPVLVVIMNVPTIDKPFEMDDALILEYITPYMKRYIGADCWAVSKNGEILYNAYQNGFDEQTNQNRKKLLECSVFPFSVGDTYHIYMFQTNGYIIEISQPSIGSLKINYYSSKFI